MAVYFVIDNTNQKLKIGMTIGNALEDIKRRFAQIRRGSTSSFTLAGYILTWDKRHEKTLHRILTDWGFHHEREWFNLTWQLTLCLQNFVGYWRSCEIEEGGQKHFIESELHIYGQLLRGMFSAEEVFLDRRAWRSTEMEFLVGNTHNNTGTNHYDGLFDEARKSKKYTDIKF